MHIAFVTSESPYGGPGSCGIAAYLRALIPALIDAGHRVTVFAKSNENQSFKTADGVTVHHLRLPSTHWYVSKIPVLGRLITLPLRQFEWSATFYRRVARVIKRDKIDVIECSETGALFLSRLAPLVVRLHGSEFSFRNHSGLPLDPSVRWNDALEAVSCKRAIAITAPSEFQANEVTARRGWPADRVRVIPNPISPAMFEAALQCEREGNSESTVLYTGRLAPVKGIETLLSAARQVHERNPAITFVLAGPWQMPRSPETYGLNLNSKSEQGVLWVGPQEQTSLIDWYQRAALFVMPSNFESFGISVLEAMAFGMQVVATNAGALPELLEDGVTGRMVMPGDPNALARAILDSFANPAEQTKMRDAARAEVLNKFTVEHALDATLRVYSGAVGPADVGLRDLEGAISSGVR